MHGVAGLKADNGAPATLLEGGSGLGRGEPVRGIVIVGRQVDDPHGPAQQHLTLAVDRGHAGMSILLRAVHRLRFAPLVVREPFGQ